MEDNIPPPPVMSQDPLIDPAAGPPAPKGYIHYSSKSAEWVTPQYLFDILNAEHHFDLDVCATFENAKCRPGFFTREQDGLAQSWEGRRVWCNPPYGRQIGKWVAKCAAAGQAGGPEIAVMLIPSRTDTKWWHDFIIPFGKITFIKGRLKFSGHKNSAPFPSAIVVFGGDK